MRHVPVAMCPLPPQRSSARPASSVPEAGGQKHHENLKHFADGLKRTLTDARATVLLVMASWPIHSRHLRRTALVPRLLKLSH